MLHITVANKPHPGLDALRLTSTSHSLQTRVLGMGSKTAIGHGGLGFGLKLDLLRQELKLLPLDSLVLFTDDLDVLVQGSVEELKQYLVLNPTSVVFAAESTKWPCKDLLYPAPLYFPYPYLNSGVFAGTANAIAMLLDSSPYTNLTDDQEYYTRLFLGGAPIVLDHEARFFQCLQGVATIDLTFDAKNQRVSITHFDGVRTWTTAPPILHLNNGTTRFRHFTSCIRTILGPQYTYLARQIQSTLLVDLLSYHSLTIFKVLGAFFVLLIVLQVRRIIGV
jgi:hypothetical protein